MVQPRLPGVGNESRLAQMQAIQNAAIQQEDQFSRQLTSGTLMDLLGIGAGFGSAALDRRATASESQLGRDFRADQATTARSDFLLDRTFETGREDARFSVTDKRADSSADLLVKKFEELKRANEFKEKQIGTDRGLFIDDRRFEVEREDERNVVLDRRQGKIDDLSFDKFEELKRATAFEEKDESDLELKLVLLAAGVAPEDIPAALEMLKAGPVDPDAPPIETPEERAASKRARVRASIFEEGAALRRKNADPGLTEASQNIRRLFNILPSAILR